VNKFILRKVKLQPNGGLKCEYQTDDRNQSMENLERSSTDVVHPDLKAAFNKMKIAIIKSFKLDWAMTYLTENLLSSDAHKAAMKVITPILEEGQLAIDNLVTVTGFSISGEGPTEGVVITGTIECKGKKQGVSSQRIVFNQQSWGFESEIEDDVLAATQEVKEYLFENKVGQAQADLFNNSDPALRS